jgi:hypothetical protein
MGFTSGGYIMQSGLGRAQFRKLETVASRLSKLRSLLRKPLFPAKWIISELPVIRPPAAGKSQSCPLRASELSLDQKMGKVIISVNCDEPVIYLKFSAFAKLRSEIDPRRQLEGSRAA